MTKTALLAALCAAAALPGAQAGARDLTEAWWAPIGRDGVQRVRIRCGPDFFDPRVIVVKANVPVELLISTTPGLASHSFMIARPERSMLSAGNAVGPAPNVVAFTPGAPGEYPMACQDDSGHSNPTQQKAKQGILTVIP